MAANACHGKNAAMTSPRNPGSSATLVRIFGWATLTVSGTPLEYSMTAPHYLGSGLAELGRGMR